jgi:hypothetical protein
MCSCTTAKCAGCTCGCFHTPATRRSYWQGLYAAREAVAAVPHGISWGTGLHIHRERALAAIDALREGDQP